MPSIVIYTGPGCPNCKRTTDYFDREAIPYTVIDVDGRDDLIADLKAQGHQQLPVVFAEGFAPWSGMRPDQLVLLKSAHQQASAKAVA